PRLFTGDEIDDGRAGGPQIGNLMGHARRAHIAHRSCSTSAVARTASSKDVMPAATLRTAWSRRGRRPSWRAVRARTSGVALSALTWRIRRLTVSGAKI